MLIQVTTIPFEALPTELQIMLGFMACVAVIVVGFLGRMFYEMLFKD